MWWKINKYGWFEFHTFWIKDESLFHPEHNYCHIMAWRQTGQNKINKYEQETKTAPRSPLDLCGTHEDKGDGTVGFCALMLEEEGHGAPPCSKKHPHSFRICDLFWTLRVADVSQLAPESQQRVHDAAKDTWGHARTYLGWPEPGTGKTRAATGVDRWETTDWDSPGGHEIGDPYLFAYPCSRNSTGCSQKRLETGPRETSLREENNSCVRGRDTPPRPFALQ